MPCLVHYDGVSVIVVVWVYPTDCVADHTAVCFTTSHSQLHFFVRLPQGTLLPGPCMLARQIKI